MKIEIAIVEDESYYLDQVSTLIEHWTKKNYCQVNIYGFTSSESFLSSFHTRYDLIFLDIELGGSNGLNLARRLRSSGYSGAIVFLTSYQEYVFEGYNVKALNYLLKPVNYNMVKSCLDTVNTMVNDDNYIYRYRDTIIKIPYHEIIYLSSCNHRTEIITTKRTFRQPGALRNIISYLPPRFEQCHRTTVVNMQHVIQVTGHNVTLSNYILMPISGTFIENIRRAFVAQIN